jgi:purine-binding chemotaxis protein CheW
MEHVDGLTRRVPLVAFTLRGERFAVRGLQVREVVRAVAISPLPDAPGIVEGVINFRGRIVAVLDIGRRFGLPTRSLDPTQHFILVDAGPRLVALRVDRATDLLDVAAEAIEGAVAVAPGSAMTEGVARLDDGLVVIHHLERFLSLDEGRMLDGALLGAAPAEEWNGGGL